jgi:hypothetical protein
MKHILFVAAAVIAIAATPVAHAEPDEKGFMNYWVARDLPGVLARYGPQAVIAEAYRVCVYEGWEYTGQIDYTGVVERIVMDMPMSRSDAITLSTLVVGPICDCCGGTA